EIPPDTERHRLIISSGMRSWLRVPVWISGQVQGGLSFFHREPSRYTWEDTEVAIRLADRVALMLSHLRLSDQARVAAEARERSPGRSTRRSDGWSRRRGERCSSMKSPR